MSNIKIEINRKLFVSKHIFECSHGLLKKKANISNRQLQFTTNQKKKILLKNTNPH